MRLIELANTVGPELLSSSIEGRKGARLVKSIIDPSLGVDMERLTGMELSRLIGLADENTYKLLTRIEIPTDDVLIPFPRKTIFSVGLGMLLGGAGMTLWYAVEAYRAGYLPSPQLIFKIAEWWIS